MKVISIDPGEVTGITWWNFDETNLNLTLEHSELVDSWLTYFWEGLIDPGFPDVIILEDFFLYPNKAQKLAFNHFVPVKIIGILQYLAKDSKVDLVLQRALQANTIPTQSLKKFNCYLKSEHLRDSTKHCIYYFLKKYGTKLKINNLEVKG